MQSIREHAKRTVGLMLGLWIVGVAGLVLVEAFVPDGAVIDALERGEDRLEVDEREQPYDNAGTRIDEWTECITLSIGLGEHRGASLLETVAISPHLGPCQLLVEHLNPHDAEVASAEERTYIRYWHGSVALVRPVLWIWGVAGLRAINTVVLLLAGAALVRSMRGFADTRTAVALTAPYALMTSVASLPGSTHQALAVGAGIAAIAWAIAPPPTATSIWYRCLLAGAAFSYIDLLTIVPGMWLLCAALIGLHVFMRGGSRLAVVSSSLGAGVAWMVGFAGMWAGKWVFASLVLGPSVVIEDVSDSVGFRLNGAYEYVDPGLGAAIESNLDQLMQRPFVGTFLLAIAIASMVVVRRGGPEEFVSRLVVAAPAAVTFVWFEILSNHSQIHAWFTYRSIPISMGVVLMALLAPTPDRAVADGEKALAVSASSDGQPIG